MDFLCLLEYFHVFLLKCAFLEIYDEQWWLAVFWDISMCFFSQHGHVCVSLNVHLLVVYDKGWWLCVSWGISICFFFLDVCVCVSLNLHLLVVYYEGWWRNWQLSGQQQEEEGG